MTKEKIQGNLMDEYRTWTETHSTILTTRFTETFCCNHKIFSNNNNVLSFHCAAIAGLTLFSQPKYVNWIIRDTYAMVKLQVI